MPDVAVVHWHPLRLCAEGRELKPAHTRGDSKEKEKVVFLFHRGHTSGTPSARASIRL